ncbi:MAG TPA: hypothetical protein PK149_04370, partial [Flavobacteriales bacterium]|nr:hypothetical protein [Flavobacteriales bacterium]
MAQTTKTDGWLTSPGVLGTMLLLVVVMFVAMLIISAKVDRILKASKLRRAHAVPIPDEVLMDMAPEQLSEVQHRRRTALLFKLSGDELGGTGPAFDDRALITRSTSEPENPLVDEKIYSGTRLDTPPE